MLDLRKKKSGKLTYEKFAQAIIGLNRIRFDYPKLDISTYIYRERTSGLMATFGFGPLMLTRRSVRKGVRRGEVGGGNSDVKVLSIQKSVMFVFRRLFLSFNTEIDQIARHLMGRKLRGGHDNRPGCLP